MLSKSVWSTVKLVAGCTGSESPFCPPQCVHEACRDAESPFWPSQSMYKACRDLESGF